MGRKEGGYYRCSTLLETPFTIGTNYTVIINGQEYKCVAYGVGDGELPSIGAKEIFSGELVGFPFNICGDGTPRPLLWSTELGTKIDLAIYEEQEVEVVKQLDPKFVGASGGGIAKMWSDGTHLYDYDNEEAPAYTYKELYEIVFSGKTVILQSVNNEWYYPIGIETGLNNSYDLEDYLAFVCLRPSGETVRYYSAEHSGSGSGGAPM